MSFTKFFFIYIIKYPYLVNLSIILNILLYFCFIIGSFNLSNLIIKSYNITSYSYITNLTDCSFSYSLYLFNLFF